MICNGEKNYHIINRGGRLSDNMDKDSKLISILWLSSLWHNEIVSRKQMLVMWFCLYYKIKLLPILFILFC